jgi:hypothetical protein
MEWRILMKVAAGLFFAAVIGWGQAITATSPPFTFPDEVGVKLPGSTPHTAMYFKYSGPASQAGVLTFTWSFPAQPKGQNGTITVYSLSGRAIKTFPVSTNAGSVFWNLSSKSVKGVYIARIICGSARQNLKILLCR